MASSLQESSFSTNPYAESQTVDPYNPSALNGLNSGQPAIDRDTADLATKIPPDQLAALQNNAELQRKLNANGLTLGQYASAMENKLPRGMDLNTALQNGIGLQDIDRDADRLKNRIDAGGDSYSPSLFLSSMKFMKNAAKITNLDFYKDALDKAGAYGFDLANGDEVTESSLALGFMNGILETAEHTGIWKYIDGTPLGNLFKGYVIRETFEMAAKKGSYKACYDIVIRHPNEIDNILRLKGISWIFENFRVGDEDLTDGYAKSARRVVGRLDYISPDWDRIELIPNQDKPNHQLPFMYGNDGVLNLMQYYDIYERPIAAAAAMQRGRKWVIEPFGGTVAAFQPSAYQILTAGES